MRDVMKEKEKMEWQEQHWCRVSIGGSRKKNTTATKLDIFFIFWGL